MKIIVPCGLPAVEQLTRENLPVAEYAANDIPAGVIRVAFINLMPEKIPAECDILRMLASGMAVAGDGMPDILVDLVRPATHVCRHTPAEHIARFYRTLSPADMAGYDAVIMNGAPLERVDFADVHYFGEMSALCDAAISACVPVLYMCWAAFFGIYRRCGIDKRLVSSKLSGVYRHAVAVSHPLVAGLGKEFYLPHSRHCVLDGNVALSPFLTVVAGSSDEPGDVIMADNDGLQVYITAHPEYDTMTLDREYHRDLDRGLNPHIPENYYIGDDPSGKPQNLWASASARLMANWLEFYVNRHHGNA